MTTKNQEQEWLWNGASQSLKGKLSFTFFQVLKWTRKPIDIVITL